MFLHHCIHFQFFIWKTGVLEHVNLQLWWCFPSLLWSVFINCDPQKIHVQDNLNKYLSVYAAVQRKKSGCRSESVSQQILVQLV